jgi:hypothetical protein
VTTTKKKRSFDAVLEEILSAAPPSFQTFVMEEPRLVFTGNYSSPDPKDGIDVAGPYTKASGPIRIGLIGTADGVDAFRYFLERAHARITPGLNAKGKPFDALAFPDFPGAEPNVGFRTQFSVVSQHVRTIPERVFEVALRAATPHDQIKAVIAEVGKQLEALADLEPEPDVVVVLMPDFVEAELRHLGNPFVKKVALTLDERAEKRLERFKAKTGQEFFDFGGEERAIEEQQARNFHNALKARAMSVGIPIQLIWQPSLTSQGLSQDPASMAWNLFTALFYKAGNIPWQLNKLPGDTCFVGIAFYSHSAGGGHVTTQTSLAQVFSGFGEGLVVKGGPAVLDEKTDRKPHLSEKAAQQLLTDALQIYGQHHDAPPRRVVVHKSSRYTPDELAGLRKALGSIYRHDFLALERSDIRFMRVGHQPPLRGTVVTLAPRRHALFTVGYVPYFRVYPGMRIPAPLEIMEHHGDSPAATVCEEVLALTKLNWNSCSFACSDPMTIHFARTVGHILSELPLDKPLPQSKYRFFM